jgi:holo-[acyl-carrier protein] synthase
MIFGIGTDIVEISRIAECYEKHGVNFLNRILTEFERKIFAERYKKNQGRGIAYLAKRFCAKEAVAKALKMGIGEDLSFQDIETSNNQKGLPIVHVNKFPDYKFKISLSDSRENAIAYVLIEK